MNDSLHFSRACLCALALAVCAGLAEAQAPGSSAVLVNARDAKWQHDAGDPPGSESILLRHDSQTGGLELLVRFPAGHVFAPHWHSSNERILLLEGRVSVRLGDSPETILEPGSFGFLPAREIQRLACVSNTRCAFYLYWDGKPTSHPATNK